MERIKLCCPFLFLCPLILHRNVAGCLFLEKSTVPSIIYFPINLRKYNYFIY